MALDLFHADAVTDGEPAGLITSGGTGSICHAVLAYREVGPRTRRHPAPTSSSPRPVTRRSTRPATSSASSCARRPSIPVTTPVDVDWVTRQHRRPDHRLHGLGLQLRLRHHRPDRSSCPTSRVETGVPLHVDGCLGGFILPFGRGARRTTSRCSTSASPASPASRPTPTSTATPSRAPPRCCSATSRGATRSTSSSPTGRAASTRSPGMDGSRSGGLLAATWAVDGPARP